MTFTDEQFKALQPYEERFTEAVIGQWARNPGKEGLTLIHDIYTKATGDKSVPLNYNCRVCILNILTACGRKYLEDKKERESAPKVAVKMPRQSRKKSNAV